LQYTRPEYSIQYGSVRQARVTTLVYRLFVGIRKRKTTKTLIHNYYLGSALLNTHPPV